MSAPRQNGNRFDVRKIVTLGVVVIFTVVLAQSIVASPASAAPDDSVTQNAPLSPLSSPPTADATIQPVPTVKSDDSSPGFFDISGRVRQAINDWFGSLVTSAINPVLDIVGKALLSAPNVTEQGEVQQIWFISVGIADTLFVLLAVVGGIVVMTHDTLQSRYSAKEVLPRLIFAMVAANASLLVCGQAIQLANALARGFLGDGLDPTTATGGLGRIIVLSAGASGFLVLLAFAATGMCLLLSCLFIARAAMVVLLAVCGPVALACHALPQTEGLAMLWWKALCACLGIQVAQALVLITGLRVFFTSSGAGLFGLTPGDALVNLLITICLFWVLLRIPTWAGRMVFGPRGGPAKSAKDKAVVLAKAALLAVL